MRADIFSSIFTTILPRRNGKKRMVNLLVQGFLPPIMRGSAESPTLSTSVQVLEFMTPPLLSGAKLPAFKKVLNIRRRDF